MHNGTVIKAAPVGASPCEAVTPEELFQKICENGVTQHYGIVDGDHLDELEELAKLCDFDFCRID